MRCELCGREHGKLMDKRSIMVEFGVKEATALAIMRKCRKATPPTRGVFVWRRDVYELLGGEP